MFNVRLRNLFIVLFLLVSLTLTYGCSSKPSEETMKGIIKSFITNGKDRPFEYESFQIINGFQVKDNDEGWYCIEVNYKTKNWYENNVEQVWTDGYGKEKRYCFTKRGNEWYGREGWVK